MFGRFGSKNCLKSVQKLLKNHVRNSLAKKSEKVPKKLPGGRPREAQRRPKIDQKNDQKKETISDASLGDFGEQFVVRNWEFLGVFKTGPPGPRHVGASGPPLVTDLVS